MVSWIDKDTEIYCSFARTAGNTGCQMMNTAFYYYGLNKIYKSFSVDSIEDVVKSVKTLNIKGFAITMPYKTQVLNCMGAQDSCVDNVVEIGAANTILNDNGILTAYNTDSYAATIFLDRYDNRKKLYIVGDGGYARAVTWAAYDCRFSVESVTRENWNNLGDIKNSIVYNCTPVDISDLIHKSNDFINCLTSSQTGVKLASLQASKQFELYTGLEFPL
jgi:shikimate dehydrogenase